MGIPGIIFIVVRLKGRKMSEVVMRTWLIFLEALGISTEVSVRDDDWGAHCGVGISHLKIRATDN